MAESKFDMTFGPPPSQNSMMVIVICYGHGAHFSVPLPTIQSETWLVRAKVREPHLNPPVRMNFLPLALLLKGKARKVHTNPGGSHVVRELSREPAMFQIGL